MDNNNGNCSIQIVRRGRETRCRTTDLEERGLYYGIHIPNTCTKN